MSNQSAREFSVLFPGTPVERSTSEQWNSLKTMAYEIQNDLIDMAKRHTPKSRYWARIGGEALAMAKLKGNNSP